MRVLDECFEGIWHEIWLVSTIVAIYVFTERQENGVNGHVVDIHECRRNKVGDQCNDDERDRVEVDFVVLLDQIECKECSSHCDEELSKEEQEVTDYTNSPDTQNVAQ